LPSPNLLNPDQHYFKKYSERQKGVEFADLALSTAEVAPETRDASDDPDQPEEEKATTQTAEAMRK
jgi:hypothetical protein